MAIGPSGWTRTATTRVKSPACFVDTTEGVELIPGIEPGRRPYQGRRLPLHQISVGANGGIRTRTSRLGRPAGSRYPTFALVRLGDAKAEHGPVSFTGPSSCIGCQRPRSCELVGGTGFEPNAAWRENGVTARQRTIRSYRPCWGQRHDSNLDPRALEARMLSVTPRCRRHFTSRPFLETEPPRDLTRVLLRASGQKKKGLPGARPGRPGSQ